VNYLAIESVTSSVG